MVGIGCNEFYQPPGSLQRRVRQTQPHAWPDVHASTPHICHAQTSRHAKLPCRAVYHPLATQLHSRMAVAPRPWGMAIADPTRNSAWLAARHQDAHVTSRIMTGQASAAPAGYPLTGTAASPDARPAVVRSSVLCRRSRHRHRHRHRRWHRAFTQTELQEVPHACVILEPFMVQGLCKHMPDAMTCMRG